MKITLLLPLLINPDRRVSDLHRFIALGLQSLNKFVSRKFIHELLVLAPLKDVSKITKPLNKFCKFPYRVLSENSICEGIAGTRGWHKQQILKLGVAVNEIKTPWYLTLDADVICVRPINEQFLLPGGKGLWQKEPASYHFEWWKGSKQFLKSDVDFKEDSIIMGVTPALMSTELSVDLINRIGALYPGDHWGASLLKRSHMKWSEYTLYWTNIVEKALVKKFYADSDRSLYAKSMWYKDDLKRIDLEQTFSKNANHGFFVFQSSIGLSLETTVKRFRPFIPVRPPILASKLHSVRYRYRKYRKLKFLMGRVYKKIMAAALLR